MARGKAKVGKNDVQLGLELAMDGDKEQEGNDSLDSATVLVHKPNFRVITPYLLEHLPRYNQRLQGTIPAEELEYDNLLLRNMFYGIQNSRAAPAEIFEAFNALEICLLEAGIWKRKFVYEGDVTVQQTKPRIREPRKVRRDPHALRYSRIYEEGALQGTLYQVVEHLLTATAIAPIWKQYQHEWPQIVGNNNPNKRQKRFKKVNPYTPESLRERVDTIESQFPYAVKQFKRVLTEPWIPHRDVRIDAHGNPKGARCDWGFDAPLRTYRRGVHGRSFHNLREYATRVLKYFEAKEKQFQGNA